MVNGVRVGDTRYTNDKVENEKLYRVYDGEKFLGLGSKKDDFQIMELNIYMIKKMLTVHYQVKKNYMMRLSTGMKENAVINLFQKIRYRKSFAQN